MNWQNEIDKAHKGQTGFFKEIENKNKSKQKQNKMKTTENNKLIAEFMGAESVVGVEYGIILTNPTRKETTLSSLAYHTSWDWLMPVVEKIESLGFEFFIVENRSKVKHNTDHSIDVLCYLEGGSKIDITYQTVVEFIKWYNQNK
jgi:hypothetical protein